MTDQEKIDFVFTALEQSKVSIKHLSALARVSRNTLHTWKRGAQGFDSVRVDMAYGVARRISKAVEIKKLPLKPGTPAAEKGPVLRAIVKSVVL